MCRIEQSKNWQWDILSPMIDKTFTEKTRIVKVEMDGEDGIIVTFSDGTIGGYVIEELLMLRPARERVEEPLRSYRPATIASENGFPMGAA
jgi:hypothetical protein